MVRERPWRSEGVEPYGNEDVSLFVSHGLPPLRIMARSPSEAEIGERSFPSLCNPDCAVIVRDRRQNLNSTRRGLERQLRAGSWRICGIVMRSIKQTARRLEAFEPYG